MRKIKTVLLTLVLAMAVQAVSIAQGSKPATEKATFGMGCFWCSEAIFQRLKGVTKVESGYAGGSVKNPTYEAVCSGTTGHAEVVQVTFQPSVISYKELLEIFWKMHDPTTLNKQGADVGTQYRSIIFYHNEQQKALANTYKAELNKQKAFPDPIVTAIEPFKNFYVAENYHQNYFKLNGSQPYCRMVILPKVDKLEKVFKQKLKQ
ncbi:peptide-methionine (S)-S-oxide reductase MsrA [Mucilaginibacter aquatilis]|uniref:Peptide methionine sulfoxide reductase MsrA n=1 Tax=Mucilaginibacter aquatilis TaxID=1517760 RepID=A0A6I4I9B8_9SPHI|nr:peptide-methionine (S)-S-oxide reductase MsrA [Mucilaginibacter aquatilis]MVN91547.1 peptide-methionine (S)-S-oxide reductase MsrA [Mucilaginibacter aquatilis]